jgi:uncharacterized protein YraI
MPSLLRRLFLVAVFLALAIPAGAQVAFTTQAVNMRAGPDRSFPLVTWLPGGVSVNVAGCIDGWRWCDVMSGRNRGWVYGRFISFSFQNQPMPVVSGGARSGIPIVTFSTGPYWNAHYRGRPWYGNQSQWSNWRPPSRAMSRPPNRPPGGRPTSPSQQRPPSRPPT